MTMKLTYIPNLKESALGNLWDFALHSVMKWFCSHSNRFICHYLSFTNPALSWVYFYIWWTVKNKSSFRGDWLFTDWQWSTTKCYLNGTLRLMRSKGATTKLWVQYFEMVKLVKQFIEGESSGNWKLHVEIIKNMLPYFHASGILFIYFLLLQNQFICIYKMCFT